MSAYSVEVYTLMGSGGFGGASMGAETLSDGIDKGREHANLLLANDPAREVVEVKVATLCETCKGSGRVLRKKHKMTYDGCKACVNSGYEKVLHKERVTRAVEE
jgi:uncharacterized protein YuzB (UPF0349 family)